MKKIFHCSDSHGYHDLLNIPECDIIIHSGDFSNYYDVYKNEIEAMSFIRWFGNLKVPIKILVAGNHDAFAAKRTLEFKTWCAHYNIIYLENDWVDIDGIKIYGSPYTPTFGNWHFMKDRAKLDEVWKNIPDDIDILVVHGPAEGILDLSYKREGGLETCGCKALRRHILGRIKPKLFCFGHLHSQKDIKNAGILYRDGIYFSNGSIVTDGEFGKLSSNGNLFEIDDNKKITILEI